jgi:hypothetical protein
MRRSLLLAVATISSAVFAAGPDPGVNVTVTNGTSQPVPVRIQGTSTVSGNVSVTNTPNVNVVNEAVVRNSDNPALQPVHVKVVVQLRSDGTWVFGGNSAYTVPAGKRLVIEHVDGTGFLGGAPTGRLMLQLSVSNEGFIGHGIGVSSEPLPCTASQSCVVIAQPVRIYANPGDQIGLNINGRITPASNFSFVELTLNGHLVDL